MLPLPDDGGFRLLDEWRAGMSLPRTSTEIAAERHSIPTRARRWVLRRCFLDRAAAPVALIAGSGRSGTTWLEDLIDFRRDHRVVFEPFHAERFPVCGMFAQRQYFRPADRSVPHERAASAVMNGRFRSLWADRSYSRLVYRKRLIKDIRANLMLGWLRRQFPSLPIVLLLRHPLAVASSQIRRGWSPMIDSALEDLRAQEPLVADFLAPVLDLFDAPLSPLERAVLLWCVENRVALDQRDDSGAVVVFYERLVANPVPELERIFSELDLQFDPAVLEDLHRPSGQTTVDSALLRGGDVIADFEHQIPAAERARALRIVARFDLDDLYGSDPSPRDRASN